MNIAQIYFRKNRRRLESLADFRVLTLALVVVSILIMGIFLFVLSRAKLQDPIIALQPIPGKYLDNPQKIVTVSLIAHTFSQFDVLKNDFVIEASIWFAFDKNHIDPELIGKFSFENGSIITKSAPFYTEIDTNKKTVGYDIKVEFKGNFNYKYFPFDLHRLDLILINKQAHLEDVVFKSDPENLVLADTAYTQDWDVYATSAHYGTISKEIKLDRKTIPITREEVIFSFNIKRKSVKSIFILFLPLFLIFFIGLLSLTFDVLNQFPIILTLNLGSITALIFYSSQLGQSAPITGVFTAVDRIYVLLLSIIIVTLTLQITSLHYIYQQQGITSLKEILDYKLMSLNIIRGIFFLFFLLLMLIVVAWLLF